MLLKETITRKWKEEMVGRATLYNYSLSYLNLPIIIKKKVPCHWECHISYFSVF